MKWQITGNGGLNAWTQKKTGKFQNKPSREEILCDQGSHEQSKTETGHMSYP